MNQKALILDDIILYDSQEKPVIQYDQVQVDCWSDRQNPGGTDKIMKHMLHARKTPRCSQNWLHYFRERRNAEMMGLPLLYAVIEKCLHNSNAQAVRFLNELKEDMGELPLLLRSVHYGDYDINKNKLDNFQEVRGYFSFPDSYQKGYRSPPFILPTGNSFVTAVTINKKLKWREALQSLFMTKNIDTTINVLEKFSGKPLYVSAPSLTFRQERLFGEVFLCYAKDALFLSCGARHDTLGYARGCSIKD